MSENIRIEYIPVGKLKNYEKNARKHAKKDVEAIMRSIEEFGFLDPIGIWGKDNTIVEGHGRLMAAKKLGITEVPCIRLDTLTDEQRIAYGIAHNKTAELSEWNYDILNLEVEALSIDMEQFGFDFINEEYEHEVNAERTQERVENIENLAKGEYYGAGKYDIPILTPVRDLPEIKEWIGFNYVLSDPNPEGKGVHFFVDDYQFTRIWNNPEKYVDKLRQYAAVATPDFSPYGDMPNALCIYNHYRKHWVGAFLQEHGVTVVPTIRASTNDKSFEWYLDGEPQNGEVIISSMWTNTEHGKEVFLREYNKMFDTLQPTRVYLYGRMIDGLRGNIVHVPSFTAKWTDGKEEDG